MTVYVVQQPSPNRRGWMPDLSSAVEHGKIEYVFSGGEKIYALPGPSLFKARRILKDFDPDTDHLLWPGSIDPMALIICMIAVMEKNPAKISVLYWDRARDKDGNRSVTDGFYIPIPVELK